MLAKHADYRPRILLLSAYDAESHQCWRRSLEQILEADITTLTLPARFFSWRVRGNPLTWWLSQRETLARSWDAIVATSMVDIATLKGLVPSLAATPTLVYFHENQFDYPVTDRAHSSVEPKITSVYTALAADRVLFNSQYNRETFLSGARQLLRKMPDGVSGDVARLIESQSAVLPVPIGDEWFELAKARRKKQTVSVTTENKPKQIIWNHRWEYDKGPDLLLAIVKQVVAQFSPGQFQWHIVGQQFRQVPKAFAEIKTLLERANMLGAWGYQSKADYCRLLGAGDIVLSTALHDFQGLSVCEAVAAGCIPVLPVRVAYPERFSRAALFGVDGDITSQAVNAAHTLQRQCGAGIAEDLTALSFACLSAQYQAEIAQLLASKRPDIGR